MEVHILSGDAQGSVQRLGNNLNISKKCLHAEKTAIEKVSWVRDQQTNKNGVIMVGDGNFQLI